MIPPGNNSSRHTPDRTTCANLKGIPADAFETPTAVSQTANLDAWVCSGDGTAALMPYALTVILIVIVFMVPRHVRPQLPL
jgi:hypothetical protein